MLSQLPTSDRCDEQYVMGYGLYVNMIVYMKTFASRAMVESAVLVMACVFEPRLSQCRQRV